MPGSLFIPPSWLRHLKGNSTEYPWLDESDAQSLYDEVVEDVWDDETDSTRDIYVKTPADGGNDVTGDGSVGSPYATLERVWHEVPVFMQKMRRVYVGAGTFSYSDHYTPGFKQARIMINGTTSVDESWTIASINSSNRDNGIQLTITGASFTVDEHVGKTIKFTSGSLNGKYGVIYDNDATDIWCTSENTGAYTVPANGDTLDLISNDTTINIVSGPIYVGKRNSIRIMRFYNCNMTGTFFMAAMSALTYWYSTLNWQKVSGGPDSVIRFLCCYLSSNAGSVIGEVGRDATIRLNRGTVVDGENLRKFEATSAGTIALQHETVFANLPATNGITLNTQARIMPDEYSSTNNTLRFHNCASGIYVPAGTSDVNIMLPYLAGNITGNWLINALGNNIGSAIDAGSVTTAIGTNTCTVDGTNESYQNDDGDVSLQDVEDFGRYSKERRKTSATDVTLTIHDHYMGVTDTAVARTVTLPPVADAGSGKVYEIADESGGAGTNNITVDGDGGELIDGVASIDIVVDNGTLKVECTGSAWKAL